MANGEGGVVGEKEQTSQLWPDLFLEECVQEESQPFSAISTHSLILPPSPVLHCNHVPGHSILDCLLVNDHSMILPEDRMVLWTVH